MRNQVLDAHGQEEGPESVRVRSVAVIGAGAMGRGIATCASNAGMATFLCDSSDTALDAAMADIGKYRKESGSVDVTATRALAQAVETVDLMIEAVPEVLETKISVFAEASLNAGERTIFATNTSHLSITEIAALCPRPESVVGLHFFNPPPVMGLVEVIPALQTARRVLESAVQFVRDLDKRPTISRDVPGFIATRGHVAQFLECARMVEDGIGSVEDIDATYRLGFRHPMGPLQLGDYIGLDVLLHVAEGMREAHGDRFRPPPLLRRLVTAGHHGKKAGRGFYRYDQAGIIEGPAT